MILDGEEHTNFAIENPKMKNTYCYQKRKSKTIVRQTLHRISNTNSTTRARD